MTVDHRAEFPGRPRGNQSSAWKLAKWLYRRSIRFRTRFPLVQQLFTEKEQIANLAMQYVRFNGVPGDYVEFGCFEGNSFIAAYHFAQAQGLDAMRFYAFDSFRGLPAFSGIDRDPDDAAQYKPGDFACDVDQFRRHLASSGVSFDKVQIVEGYYGDSLTAGLKTRLPLRQAAVVMIDCDLYESTRQVLDFITGYLVHGAVLICDDWYNFKGDARRGEQKAFAEWLGRHPRIQASRYRDFAWHGASFVLSIEE